MSPIPFMHAISKLGRLVAAALAILALAPGAQGAAVDAGDLARLRSEAQRNGAVPVMVHLENVSLERMRGNLPELQAAMRAKAARLMDELGQAAWAAGRWENGVGQIGMHVTPCGLDILAGSPNALSFFPDKRWNERAPFDGSDGSHAEIERLLALQPYIDVEVIGNIDGLSVEHQRDGTVHFRATPQAVVDAARKLRALLDSAADAEIQNRASAAAALAASTAGAGALDPRVALRINPRTFLRINRQGLLRLALHEAVRSIRPIGFADRRERQFDGGLIERASRDGTAEVVISVRNPYAGGLLSRASLEAGESANRAALLEILADAGVQAPSHDFSRFGAVAARLTSGQLTRLRDSADPRLLAVVENKAVAMAIE